MGLFEIENKYFRKGYQGNKLAAALKKDKEYRRILKQKRVDVQSSLKLVTQKELKKYVLSEKEDFIILNLIHSLERQKLSSADRALVEIMKAQLEHDWRRSILNKLKNLLRKYSSPL